ncbi:hypothetical protein, partial [Vagococcus teuberi]
MRKTLKETIIDAMTSSKKKSFSVEQLAEMLGLQKSNDFKELVQAIAQMEREQLVTFNQKGKIKLVTKETVLEG